MTATREEMTAVSPQNWLKLSCLAISCAMAVAACAPTAQRLPDADTIHAAAPVERHAKPRVRPVKRALLVSPSAPDCEFKDSELETADPNLWARLKLDYERQCYRKAEVSVRNRLRLLQASLRTCEIESVRQSSIAAPTTLVPGATGSTGNTR